MLVEIAKAQGLQASSVADYLAGDEGHAEVLTQLARAPELGISGVPGYYLANSFLLPGAQTSEVMAQIITRVKTKLVN